MSLPGLARSRRARTPWQPTKNPSAALASDAVYTARLVARVQVIRLSGYASDEKVAIARKYLEPQAAKDAGVPAGAVQLQDDAMATLIDEYCRCAGLG